MFTIHLCVITSGQGLPKSRCRKGVSLPVTGSSGYLTSNEAEKKNLGTETCPWNITVQAGQRINLTLFDFNAYGSMSAGGSRQQEKCTIYAHIVETIGGSVQDTVVCASRKRQNIVYSSKTHTILVSIKKHPPESPPAFAFKYDGRCLFSYQISIITCVCCLGFRPWPVYSIQTLASIRGSIFKQPPPTQLSIHLHAYLW